MLELLEKLRAARENCCADEVSRKCPNVIITSLTDVQPYREACGAGPGGQEGEQECNRLPLQLNAVIRVATCGKCCSEDQKQRGAPSCIISDVTEVQPNLEVDGDGRGGRESVMEGDRPKTSVRGSVNEEDTEKEFETPTESERARVAQEVNANNPDSEQVEKPDNENAAKDAGKVLEKVADSKDPPDAMPKDGNFSHEASFDDLRGGTAGFQRPDSPLIIAVKLAKLEDIKKALRESPEAVNEPDMYLQTPIFWAVRHGNMGVMQILLKAKAQVRDVANKFGYTPLMRAVHYGQLEVGEKLLNLRADLDALDKFNGSVLQVAATAGQIEAVQWLLSKRQDVMHQLVLNSDEDGRTPLHVAAKNGHSTVVYMLLEAHAVPNTRDRHGRPPLLFSLARNDVLSAQSLIYHKAEIDFRDPHGRPLLHVLVEHLCANRQRSDTLCGLVTLLQADVNINEKDRNALTPMMIAVRGNHPMMCALLAAFDADLRNLSGIARACAFFEIAAVLEEFTVLRQNQFSKSIGVKAIQCFLKDVKAVSKMGEELAYALSNSDSEFVVDKLQELSTMEFDVRLENVTLTHQLADFLVIQRKLLVDTSLKGLREVRLHEREWQFLEFRRELRAWHEKNELDPKGLQAVIGEGVSGILKCKLTSLELEDPHTRATEDAQTGLINDLMQKFTNMYSVVFEEQSALGAFPAREHQIVIHELQCPKCLVPFSSKASFADHAKYCSSKVREDQQKEYKNSVAKKADIAIHRLEDAVRHYEERIQTFQDLLEETNATKQACRKKTPGAMIPLRACALVLEMIIQLMKGRYKKCRKAAEEAEEKWFPNGSREAGSSMGVSCAICLVEKATRIGVHVGKGNENHHVACTQCAIVLQTKLMRGEPVSCPVCKVKLKRLEHEDDAD